MTTPTDHLRLEGAVRFYGRCQPWCEPDEDTSCTCGYEALVARIDELREHDHTDQGETDGVV